VFDTEEIPRTREVLLVIFADLSIALDLLNSPAAKIIKITNKLRAYDGKPARMT